MEAKKETSPGTPPEKNPNLVELETPIKRGETEITEITLHKPNSGALRGCSLRGLLEFQANDIITVIPRVTDPQLTPAEAATLDPVDLLQIGAKVADFLLTKRARDEAMAQLSPSA